MSPLLTAAYLHEAGEQNYSAHLDSWAEWAMYDMPRTEEGGLQHITYLVDNFQQLWDDTLMMTVLPLTKIGLVLGRREYIEEAKRQFLIQWVAKDIIKNQVLNKQQHKISARCAKRPVVPRYVSAPLIEDIDLYSFRLDVRRSPSLCQCSMGPWKLLGDRCNS